MPIWSADSEKNNNKSCHQISHFKTEMHQYWSVNATSAGGTRVILLLLRGQREKEREKDKKKEGKNEGKEGKETIEKNGREKEARPPIPISGYATDLRKD